MTDIERTIQRITSANPVPFKDTLPSNAMSASDLLARIDDRSTAMTETLTPVRNLEPNKPPRRSRGPLIAVGVAAVVILLVGLFALNTFTGSELPVAEDPTPTTQAPVTTQAPATTVPAPVSGPISPLGPDAPPLAVMETLQSFWDAGDLAGGESLFHPDSQYFVQNTSPGFATELWYREAIGATIEHQCGLDTPAELAAYSPVGVMVTCTDTITSGDGDIVGGGQWSVDVNDGWVMEIFLVEYLGALEERGGIDQFTTEYRTWVQERFPDDFDTLFADGVLIVDNDAAQAQHRELIPFFVTDTGPRDERALPADTPLREVVSAFAERWDAGDVAGYEAIFHPLSGYTSGQDAATSWFVAVTGTTTERDCEQISDTQIRCIEITSPGLAPGTTLDPVTVVWNGAAGYLWTIEFPDGAPGYFADPGAAPGVEEYRDWVRENRADEFESLFAAGLAMRLDTQEARDAHVEMIGDYMAATAN